MAGAGTVSLEALAVCRRGVANVLDHLGVVVREKPEPRRGDGQILELPGISAYVYATADGIFEPFHANGSKVSAGEPTGGSTAPGTRRVRRDAALHHGRHLYGRRQPGW